MFWDISMRQILPLIGVLKELVRIDRIAPYAVGYQLQQSRGDRATKFKPLDASINFLIDTVDNIVSILETLEEFDELWIILPS